MTCARITQQRARASFVVFRRITTTTVYKLASIHKMAENLSPRLETYSRASWVLPEPEIPHKTAPFR
ncbi:mRNA stability protein [Fusarium oxysporum f. sp. albedinis]|nr:mRNA stability protein [Fusarium oxysporum f. sp. albedinis]